MRILFIGLLALASAAAQNVTLTVSSETDTGSGINGRLNMFVSSAFQPAQWDYPFFGTFRGAAGQLWQRAPQHINMQPVGEGVPQTGPDSWDFSDSDPVVQALLGLSDHSPLYQIAVAPAFLYNSSGQFPASNFPTFAQYSANLVRYYNTGGFDAGGTHFASASPWPIVWWGIFNEPNFNNISASDYVTLYNTTVAAMLAVDPNIKIVALELGDVPQVPQQYLPTFMQGVTTQVDAVAAHFYGTCDQSDTDETLFNNISWFAQDTHYIRTEMNSSPAFASKPLWITENNVNGDYEASNGMSTCNPGQKFIEDARGSSAFFAAWRPFVYLSLAKAGAQSLHHWDYDADVQYGEVNYNTDATYLSYWVNYYLNHLFPSPPGANILSTTMSDSTQGVDTLAVRNDDGSAVVMVVNHAIANPATDNNGPGLTRTVNVDVSALGTFQSANLITIDSTTSAATGPTLQSVSPAATIPVTLNGYSVAFLRLNARAMNLGSIVNAASMQAGAALVPGELVLISGAGLGPSAGAAAQTSTPGFLDNFVAGTRVWFGGFAAPVLYTTANEVYTVVPWEITGPGPVLVRAEYLGQFSNLGLTTVGTHTAPAIFTADGSGTGQAAALNNDRSGSFINSATNPVTRGSTIEFYLTGAGLGGDAVDGRIETGQASLGLPVTVNIGRQSTTATYAGDAQGAVSGLVEVTAVVPQSVSPGSAVPLTVTIGGVTSPPGVTIAVK